VISPNNRISLVKTASPDDRSVCAYRLFDCSAFPNTGNVFIPFLLSHHFFLNSGIRKAAETCSFIMPDELNNQPLLPIIKARRQKLMPKETPYRILFTDPADEYDGWNFDETEYETPKAAHDDAMKRYIKQQTLIVKICPPVDNG
jgi:hypothetical protein